MASFHLLSQDPLTCFDENLDFFSLCEERDEEQSRTSQKNSKRFHLSSWEWVDGGGEDEKAELSSMLAKQSSFCTDPSVFLVRESAVEWMMRSRERHGFGAQTGLLAVNCLDRFLSVSVSQQPWMAQLSAVACLSLAAKMEEIKVPLLLDLQVEESKFVFEPKTVQRMELLVLSSLGWRLGSPTPLSFIDHFLRRLAGGIDRHSCLLFEFQATCHSLLLKLAAHSRWIEFLPSVMAAATMVHAVGLLDQNLVAGNLQSCVMSLAAISNEEFESCAEFIASVVREDKRRRKRRAPSPESPRGVVEVTFSDETTSSVPPSQPGSVSSSPAAAKRLKPLYMSGGVF